MNPAYKMKNSKGFTLIEILVVISIMGILLTITPFKAPVEKFKLETEIEIMAADLRWARKRAILDNESYIFRIYTVKEKTEDSKIPYYFYIKEDDKKIIKRKGYYSAKYVLYKTLSHKVVKKDYYEWIRFNNTATARAGTIALGTAEKNSKKYSITINQLGRVRIEK